MGNFITYSKQKWAFYDWIIYTSQLLCTVTFIIFTQNIFLSPNVTTKYKYILKPNAVQYGIHEPHLATEIN